MGMPIWDPRELRVHHLPEQPTEHERHRNLRAVADQGTETTREQRRPTARHEVAA